VLFDAMFLDPGGFQPQLLVLAVSLTGLVVGLLWIRRITRFDEGPSRFRYRRVHGIRHPARTGPTFRWVATRSGMAAGLAALILPAVLILFSPNQMHDDGSAPWASVLIGSGWVGLIIGNLWLYRILRGDSDPDARAWRYRR
jgi:hypothetical protein